MKKILHLTLKKEWFDLIASRKKKWEYRKFNSYWIKRLTYRAGDEYTISGRLVPKEFDEIYFRNGYRKECPFMRVKFKRLEVGEFQGEQHFKIKLGKILEIKNWG